MNDIAVVGFTISRRHGNIPTDELDTHHRRWAARRRNCPGVSPVAGSSRREANLLVLTRILFVVVLLAAALACFAAPVRAAGSASPAPVGYHLDLVLRSPVWSSQSGTVSDWRTTEFGGRLLLDNVISSLPQLHPFVAGMHAFGDWGSIFDAKNELQAGFDYPLGRGVTFETYYDHHFTENVDRVFVALKYGASGLF